MEIKRKVAYKNIKCHECGNTIYEPKKENEVYFCSPDYTSTRKWKLCKGCFNKIFSEEVRRKVK